MTAPGGGAKADDVNGPGEGALNARMIEFLDLASAALGDPADHTVDDADDGDGDMDGPDPKWSCNDRCGKEAGDGFMCSCHFECVDDECCKDFEAKCPSEADVGDDGDDGDDGDWDGDPSCVGACGDISLSGSCMCDPGCVEAQDCCDDYTELCASAPPQPDAGPDLATPAAPTMAAGEPCLKFIEDETNLRKILEYTGEEDHPDAVNCLAAAMVVWTPAKGTHAPVSALVCLGRTADGGMVGAGKSYIKQKRSDLPLCTNDTSSEVTESITDGTNSVRGYGVG